MYTHMQEVLKIVQKTGCRDIIVRPFYIWSLLQFTFLCRTLALGR